VGWSGYRALPPYFGGKRKLCGRIFREISRVYPTHTWSQLSLVDPSLGGGAVSLYAKARGFAVLCGDLAERSVIVGRALIENDSATLTEADLLRLFVPSEIMSRP
jgi:adenine-specific DNA methylase